MKSKWPQVEAKLFLIKMWGRDGVLEKDMAKKLGVAVSTFEQYKLDHPELCEALKEDKEIADYEVENSLYKKCVGHYAKEQRAIKCRDIYYDEQGRRCESERIEVVDVDVFIQPDTTAIAIYLNNKVPHKYRRNAGKEALDDKKFEHQKEIDGKKYW